MADATTNVAGGPITQTQQPWAERVGSHLKGAILVVLTFLIGGLGIYFLSAILAQTRLSGITIDGASVSIWKLSYVGEQWADLRRQGEVQRLVRRQVESDRDVFSATAGSAQGSWNQKWSEMGALLDIVSQRVAEKYPDLNVQDPNRAVEVIVKILARRAELTEKYPDLAPLIDSVENRSASYREAHEKLASVNERSRWILLRLSTLTDDIKTKGDEQTNLVVSFKPNNMDDATRSRIENAFYELYAGQPSDWGFLRIIPKYWRILLTMQPDTLTLWLVLAMGVLGSSLQVTHASFKSGTAVTTGGYFLRLSVGALTALIIFIVAKAGVPIIADSGRMGSDGSINPYFVSFLAIISGLLSENAIANIQAQGARIFGQASAIGQLRWAR
jgi:hypothetical protein